MFDNLLFAVVDWNKSDYLTGHYRYYLSQILQCILDVLRSRQCADISLYSEMQVSNYNCDRSV